MIYLQYILPREKKEHSYMPLLMYTLQSRCLPFAYCSTSSFPHIIIAKYRHGVLPDSAQTRHIYRAVQTSDDNEQRLLSPRYNYTHNTTFFWLALYIYRYVYIERKTRIRAYIHIGIGYIENLITRLRKRARAYNI